MYRTVRVSPCGARTTSWCVIPGTTKTTVAYYIIIVAWIPPPSPPRILPRAARVFSCGRCRFFPSAEDPFVCATYQVRVIRLRLSTSYYIGARSTFYQSYVAQRITRYNAFTYIISSSKGLDELLVVSSNLTSTTLKTLFTENWISSTTYAVKNLINLPPSVPGVENFGPPINGLPRHVRPHTKTKDPTMFRREGECYKLWGLVWVGDRWTFCQ